MPATPRKPGMCADCGTRKPGPLSKSRCDKCHWLQTERGKRYRAANREKLRNADRERRRQDEEYRLRRNADQVAYQRRYPERTRAVVQARRARPEAKINDRKTTKVYLDKKRQDPEWVVQQREYKRPLWIRRRAIARGAEGHFAAWQWRALCASYGHRCAYCGEHKPLTVDHDLPLSRGGSNYIDNILPACRNCNSQKNTKTADEFCKSRL